MNKQVNLPYNSIILVNVAPLTKTFECTNLKAFPSFHDPILSDSKITAIHLICLILILVYVNMYPYQYSSPSPQTVPKLF